MRSRNLRLVAISLLALTVVIFPACKKQPPKPPPPPPPAPVAAAPERPTATLTISPSSIERGQSATIEWRTTNANEVAIEGLGTVNASGSQSIRPTQSTTYRLTAKGPGGSTDASQRVTVTNPPPVASVTPPSRPNPTEEELFAQGVKSIYFDYDQYTVRDDQRAAMQGNGNFFRTHPNLRLVIEGHCDERGSAEYNLGLGDRRANALKEVLVGMGIPADRIRTLSYGKERPVCSDASEDCYQKNRRGQFVLDR